MKKHKPHFEYRFSAGEISAIMAAIPLIYYVEADTEAQTQINYQLAYSLGNKLAAGDLSLSPNEIRIMHIAVCLALDAFSADAESYYDSEDIDAVKPYFFEYNHLNQVFEPLIDSLLST